MVRRGEITDRAWRQIEPLLPEYGQSGGHWRDHRTIINGILWELRTGSPWRDLPERYGPWQTCFDRFNRWRRDGTWDRLLTHAQTRSEGRWGCRVGGERRRHGNPGLSACLGRKTRARQERGRKRGAPERRM